MSAPQQAVPNTFAMRLRSLREIAGLSQAQLADEVGVSQAAIGQWERGEFMPRRRNVIALAKALGADVELLLNGWVEKCEGLAVAAPTRAQVVTELLMAELIIVTMFGLLSVEQKAVVQAQLTAAGIAGADPIRSQERRAAIVAGGAA